MRVVCPASLRSLLVPCQLAGLFASARARCPQPSEHLATQEKKKREPQRACNTSTVLASMHSQVEAKQCKRCIMINADNRRPTGIAFDVSNADPTCTCSRFMLCALFTATLERKLSVRTPLLRTNQHLACIKDLYRTCKTTSVCTTFIPHSRHITNSIRQLQPATSTHIPSSLEHEHVSASNRSVLRGDDGYDRVTPAAEAGRWSTKQG
jgi:hypothetical protein